jgi:hypothetical protein
MKKLFYFAFLLVAVSCSKAPVVEITAGFTTNKDVYQVGEEVIIENTTVVENDFLAFCEWEYDGEEEKQYHYGLEFEGLSFKTPGTYVITLTSYTEAHSVVATKDTYSKTIVVIDENDTPWAFFTCPDVIKVGEEVIFKDGSQDKIGGVQSWHWTIGEIVNESENASVVFEAPVTGLVVTLSVTDVYGAQDSFSRTIDVIE